MKRSTEVLEKMKMQSTTQKKVIYNDSGKDIAITGEIIHEDDFFISIKNNIGKTYRIGKRSIICIKEVQHDGLAN